MVNLGRVLGELNRRDEAEALVRQCLETQREVLGAEHARTLNTASELGTLLGKMGLPAEAEAMLRGTLEAQQRTLGLKHADSLKTAERFDAFLKARVAPSH